MTPKQAFVRKLVYIGLLVALLVPTAYLSLPSVARDQGGPGGYHEEGGGLLAQKRQHYRLNNASLGDIDPASETVKLCLLGLRPIAANILWTKAHDYKKKEDWSNMITTVQTITKVQPYFEEVWWFQGWNVAYNVSAEWDDYRDRYYWVKQGIDFMLDGVKVNNDSPTLLYWTGWVTSHKLGKADEQKQYRRLFRDDDEFQAKLREYRPLESRDSWYVGKMFLRDAQTVLDRFPERTFHGTSPVIFMAAPCLNNFYWAMALTQEGVLGEEVREKWAMGEAEWSGRYTLPGGVVPLGERDIELALETDIKIHLNDQEEYERLCKDAWRRLIGVLGEANVTIELDPLWYFGRRVKEARERAALVQGPLREEALAIAEEIALCEHRVNWIEQYREIVNFTFWRTRAQAEQTQDALAAREDLVAAQQAHQVDADLWRARDEYARHLEHWRLITAAYPRLAEDVLSAENLTNTMVDFDDVMRQLGETFPQPGYGYVSVDEVRDWPALLAQLREKSEPLGTAVADALGDRLDTLDDATMEPADRMDVLFPLNDLIDSPEFTDLVSVPESEHSPVARAFAALPADERTAHQQRRMNRHLLVAAWPELIAPPVDNRFVLWEMMTNFGYLLASKEVNDEPFSAVLEDKLPDPADAPMSTTLEP